MINALNPTVDKDTAAVATATSKKCLTERKHTSKALKIPNNSTEVWPKVQRNFKLLLNTLAVDYSQILTRMIFDFYSKQ